MRFIMTEEDLVPLFKQLEEIASELEANQNSFDQVVKADQENMESKKDKITPKVQEDIEMAMAMAYEIHNMYQNAIVRVKAAPLAEIIVGEIEKREELGLDTSWIKSKLEDLEKEGFRIRKRI